VLILRFQLGLSSWGTIGFEVGLVKSKKKFRRRNRFKNFTGARKVKVVPRSRSVEIDDSQSIVLGYRKRLEAGPLQGVGGCSPTGSILFGQVRVREWEECKKNSFKGTSFGRR